MRPGGRLPALSSMEGGDVGVYRAGELVGGSAVPEALPAWGWWSPGYGRVGPCLRVVALDQGELPTRFISRWSVGAGTRELTVQVTWAARSRHLSFRLARLGRTLPGVEEA